MPTNRPYWINRYGFFVGANGETKMDIKKLQEDRKAALDKMEELRGALKAEDRDEFTAEEREAWEAANKDFDKRQAQIEQEEAYAERKAKAEQHNVAIGREDQAVDNSEERDVTPTAEDRSLVLNGWARMQMLGEARADEQAAAQRMGFPLTRREFPVTLQRQAPRLGDQRALAVGTTTAGGYTVPEGFVPNLESAMLHYGGIRQVAEIMRTDAGNDMPWPTANDTTNTGAMIDENTQDSEADMTFGQVVFGAYKGTSKIVRVSREMLEDSAFELGAWLPDKLGERLGRLMNSQGTTGTGSSAPKGIVTAATLGKTTTSATAITFDELIDLLHSVDPAYRENPGAGWMFHDNVLKALRKVKDGDNNYIWQPANVQTGAPAQLYGKPYTVNQSMSSTITASDKTVLFGDLSKFKFREVRGIHLKYLSERYADYDQYGFVALVRFDCDLLDAGTHPVKYLAQNSGS